MKLVHPDMISQIELSPGSVCSLVIENPSFLYAFVSDIYGQMQKQDGKVVISENGEILSIAKIVDISTDMIDFEINRKALLTKINEQLVQTSLREEHLEETMHLLAQIEQYVQQLCLEYDADLYCQDVSAQQVIKMAGIQIESNYATLAEKIYTYMKLVREFAGEKVFVFVNLRGFLSEHDYQLLIDTVKNHEFMTLFIDNKEYPLADGEKRVIIDYDLCEI